MNVKIHKMSGGPPADYINEQAWPHGPGWYHVTSCDTLYIVMGQAVTIMVPQAFRALALAAEQDAGAGAGAGNVSEDLLLRAIAAATGRRLP